ncbi:MAG: S9 family peptidase [Bacillota bacterium]
MSAKQKRNFKATDIYNLNLPNEPQISPDGKNAAFVVQKWDKEKDNSITNIKMINLDNGEERTVTTGCCDRYPRFSPDGSKLAFISERSGHSAIWIIDLKGAEPWKISGELEVNSPPVWSPAGNKIVFSAYQDYEDEEEKRDDITIVEKLYHKFDGYGFFRGKYSQIFTAEVKDPEFDQKITQITANNYNHYHPAFSPEGDKIACTVMREDYLEKGVYKHDLCYYDLNKDKFEIILKGRGPVRYLDWSKDGDFLVYIGHQNKYGRATTNNLWLVPVNCKCEFPINPERILNLTENLERPVGTAVDSDLNYCCLDDYPFKWSADGENIYFIAADRGSSYIYKFNLTKKLKEKVLENKMKNIENDLKTEKVLGNKKSNIRAFSLDKNKCLAVISRVNRPDELFYFSDFEHMNKRKKGNDVEFNNKQLTQLNKDLVTSTKLYSAEKFQYKGAKDWEIDGWILNKDKSENNNKPLIVIVHGGPHLAYGSTFMLQAQIMAAQGYAVFYANPRGSQSYGQKFTSAVVKDWGNYDYKDVVKGIDYILEKGWADKNKIYIMGWSYGGYLSCLLLAHSKRFKAGAAGGSVTNLYSFYGTSDIGYSFGEFETGGSSCYSKEKLISRSPINYVHEINNPLLILHGEDDLRCPISQSEELFTALKRCNKKTTFIRYKDEMHLLNKPSHIIHRFEKTLEWFSKY